MATQVELLQAELRLHNIALQQLLVETQTSRIFKATRGIDEHLAIKVLDNVSTPQALSLLNETRALARLGPSEYIVQVRGCDLEGSVAWMALEWCDGGSLAEVVASVGPMDPAAATMAGIRTARALGHALQAGVLHLDIKPANLLIGHGRVKLTDFGIAQRAGGASLGWTPSHAAPEQATNGRLSAAADSYALASTIFELLTGEPPYGRSDTARSIKTRAAAKIHLPDLSSIDHPGIREYLENALQPVAARRYPDSPWTTESVLCELSTALTGYVIRPILEPARISAAPADGNPSTPGQIRIATSAKAKSADQRDRRRTPRPVARSRLPPAPQSGTDDQTIHRGHEARAPKIPTWPFWIAGVSVASLVLLLTWMVLRPSGSILDIDSLAEQSVVTVLPARLADKDLLSLKTADLTQVEVSLDVETAQPVLIQRLEYALQAPTSSVPGDQVRVLKDAGSIQRSGTISVESPARFRDKNTTITTEVDPGLVTCFQILEATDNQLQRLGTEQCAPLEPPQAAVLGDPPSNAESGASVLFQWQHSGDSLVADWWLIGLRRGDNMITAAQRFPSVAMEGMLEGTTDVCVRVVAVNVASGAFSPAVGSTLDGATESTSNDVCPWV